ncbi:glycosyltransferase family 2 protein [Candidatus Methylopumilus universalis]|uniref:Glycosyltransferase family 2 protein n=1 Tax=Candidatus Methylopumilus universalis TaxID=2588536 RepID=A0ABX5VTS2_9PROT|nr:glycosyltransferase family A protein [Candidatus Methylopumilus universalis]QDC51235.1 glycosyltransferase family 2 protein [Candidatus Methylopumilus universalis]QDC61373.1 glycosyltransferase family 2 protein [Candidatus Methylopumilus universalis]
MNFPVTLVIPILNEAYSLPYLLQSIKEQSHRPDQIIFSDAGSTDGGPSLIRDWWHREGWKGGECLVLSCPGAMPGAGRNAGVDSARNEWIAFIDGGITPTHDWLERLCKHALEKKVPVVFGVCEFSADTRISKAVCALSYGCGSVHPVIPASLFARQVFVEIGGFPSYLRAGEDLVWMAALYKRYGDCEVCVTARVKYTHFPENWLQVFNKWRVTELNCVLAGVRSWQHKLYLFGFPFLYLLPIYNENFGNLIFLAYILFRGVIDPIRRSQDCPWWKKKVGAAFLALPLVGLIDMAKWIGIIQGILLKLSAGICLD